VWGRTVFARAEIIVFNVFIVWGRTVFARAEIMVFNDVIAGIVY
jgi:hypothetical protein